MRHLCSGILVLFFFVLVAAPAAHAEKRIALLIGNQGYSAEIGKLSNPHNDIALLEKTLKDLQFEVVSVRDATLGTMHQAVNAYARRVKAAGAGTIGFFYYAGHGASDAGTNYLIPVDVKSAEEGDLWDVSLRLTEVTSKLRKEAGNATHFVVFDACRNELKLRKADTRALVQSRGFVPVQQETGMLIAYATAEGALASDVGVGAGPYSSVLAEEIVKPGVEAVTMFRKVQLRVRAAIKQEPYLGFNALGDVYFGGLLVEPPKAAVARLSEAAEAWTHIRDTTNTALLEAYAKQFEQTFYGAMARDKLDQLRKADETREFEKARRTEELRKVEEVRKVQEAESARKVEAQRVEEVRKADEARKTAETAKIASLNVEAAGPPAPSSATLDKTASARALQKELVRVGCQLGEVDQSWSTRAKRALAEFARVAKATTIPTDEPSEEALKALADQKGRVCPLVCGANEVEAKGKCVVKAKSEPRRAEQNPPSPKAGGESKSGKQPMCRGNTGGSGVFPCGDPRASGVRVE